MVKLSLLDFVSQDLPWFYRPYGANNKKPEVVNFTTKASIARKTVH